MRCITLSTFIKQVIILWIVCARILFHPVCILYFLHRNKFSIGYRERLGPNLLRTEAERCEKEKELEAIENEILS